jgi:hypothetical protein
VSDPNGTHPESGATPAPIQPQPVPFNLNIRRLGPELRVAEFRTFTGVFCLFMTLDEMGDIGKLFIQEATGIVHP